MPSKSPFLVLKIRHPAVLGFIVSVKYHKGGGGGGGVIEQCVTVCYLGGGGGGGGGGGAGFEISGKTFSPPK